GRPARPNLCRAGSFPSGAGGLSSAGAWLDQPPRGLDVAGGRAPRPRARGDLPEVPVSDAAQGGQGGVAPCPPSLPREKWWARFRLRSSSSSYGGQVALPTLGLSRHIPSAGQLTIQGIPNWSTHMPKPLAQKVLL